RTPADVPRPVRPGSALQCRRHPERDRHGDEALHPPASALPVRSDPAHSAGAPRTVDADHVRALASPPASRHALLRGTDEVPARLARGAARVASEAISAVAIQETCFSLKQVHTLDVYPV